MLLADADRLAQALQVDLSPFCERFLVAGSVRRRKAEPKDIELVLIPRYREQVIDLFGKTERVNLLHEYITRESRYTAIKPGVPGIEPWHLNPAGLYWRLLVDGVKVDVFLCTPDSWGLNVVIRTGSGVGQDGRPRDGLRPRGARPLEADHWRRLFTVCPVAPSRPRGARA